MISRVHLKPENIFKLFIKLTILLVLAETSIADLFKFTSYWIAANLNMISLTDKLVINFRDKLQNYTLNRPNRQHSGVINSGQKKNYNSTSMKLERRNGTSEYASVRAS